MRKNQYLRNHLYKTRKVKGTNLSNNSRYFLIEFKKFREILSRIDKDKRKLIVDKARRFMSIDTKEEEKTNRGTYATQFRKFEFVRCHFTGIGFEWDLPHFALVWDVNPKMDSVLVIPTTSVKRDEHIDVFPVGQIPGLPKATTHLLISDITMVSRKRLEKIKYKHDKYGLTNPRLAKSWEDRIEQGIVSKTLQKPAFETIISQKCNLCMVSTIRMYNDLKFKAIIDYSFDKKTNSLTYRIWNKDTSSTIQLISPTSSVKISTDHKKQKLNWLNSKDNTKRSLARQFFSEIYGINS